MIIETKYNIGDVVFIKTDTEQLERMITEVSVKSPHYLLYLLAHSTHSSWHSEIEFQTEISLATKLKN